MVNGQARTCHQSGADCSGKRRWYRQRECMVRRCKTRPLLWELNRMTSSSVQAVHRVMDKTAVRL